MSRVGDIANDPAAIRAIEGGHVLEWDPPGFSSVLRWTCSACGMAALNSRTVVYGEATQKPCPGAKR